MAFRFNGFKVLIFSLIIIQITLGKFILNLKKRYGMIAHETTIDQKPNEDVINICCFLSSKMAETSNLQTSCWKLANKVITKTGWRDQTWNLNVQRISKSKPCMCSRWTLGSHVKLKYPYFKKIKLTKTWKIN